MSGGGNGSSGFGSPNYQDPGFQSYLQNYNFSSPQTQSYSTQPMTLGNGSQPWGAFNPGGVSMDPQQAAGFSSFDPSQGQSFGAPVSMGPQSGAPSSSMPVNMFQPAPQMSMSDPGFQKYMSGTGIDPNSAAGQAMFKSYSQQGPQTVQTPQAPQGPGDNSMGSAYYAANPMGQQQAKGIVLSEGPKPLQSRPLAGPIPGMPWWGQQVGDTYLQGPTAGLLGGAAAAGGSPSPGYQFNVQQQRWMLPPG